MGKNLIKMKVLVLIILSIITYAIYIPIWFLQQRKAINSLKSKTKLTKSPIIILLILYIISAILLIPLIMLSDTSVLIVLNLIDTIITWVGIIITLVLSFRVRQIFIQHYNSTLKKNIKFSFAATFFFWIFYLQYKINRISN